LNTGHYNISGSARGRLAFLMAIQEYRVPWMRQTMEDMMKAVQERIMTSMIDRPGFLEERINEMKAEEGRETNVTADDLRHCFRTGQIGLAPNPGSSLWAMGAVAEKVTEIYFGLRWTILESKAASFVTSDCPVHRFYSPAAPERPYVGLADDRIQVRFPISRQRMLVAEHDFKRMDIWQCDVKSLQRLFKMEVSCNEPAVPSAVAYRHRRDRQRSGRKLPRQHSPPLRRWR
jgi:hypothetical protein